MSKQCAFPNCGYYANPNSKYCAFHDGEIDDLDDLEAEAAEVNATWKQPAKDLTMRSRNDTLPDYFMIFKPKKSDAK